MRIRPVIVHQQVLAKTIEALRQGGRARTERFALWLGQKTETQIRISEAYVPDYDASSDYFHIERPAMANLMEHLRENELMIGAQLHTHPERAFHSEADDRWAIVRHVGALSIVLPYFARGTTLANFLSEAKIFSLTIHNQWIELPQAEARRRIEVSQ